MSDTEELPLFDSGYYRHFKGGECYAAAVARDSEDRNKFVVLYYSLEKKTWNVRPYASDTALPDEQRNGFIDTVHRLEYEGPRFTWIDPATMQGNRETVQRELRRLKGAA